LLHHRARLAVRHDPEPAVAHRRCAPAAVAGCFIAAGLTTGMLFEGWLGDRDERVHRRTLLLATAALTVALVLVLDALAGTIHCTHVAPDDWVEHVALDALSTAFILHVAVGRRWPFLRHGVLAARP
jgi:MFS family permease